MMVTMSEDSLRYGCIAGNCIDYSIDVHAYTVVHTKVYHIIYSWYMYST